MLLNTNPFKMPPWYKLLYSRFKMWLKHIKNPENVWYGGGLKRETALRSVGKGWSKIIHNLYDAKPKHTNVMQVKEKYAGLRFYISGAPEWYNDLIEFYEGKSLETCEQCGKKGKPREDLSWMLTLCDDCYEPPDYTGDSDHEHDDRIL